MFDLLRGVILSHERNDIEAFVPTVKNFMAGKFVTSLPTVAEFDLVPQSGTPSLALIVFFDGHAYHLPDLAMLGLGRPSMTLIDFRSSSSGKE